MAFLNKTTQIVDCVLTRKGRELLTKNSTDFKITKFALGDDEINYGLWNPNHPSGSDYYGASIIASPVFEAVTDESIGLRYKLITLPKGSTGIPYITVTPQVSDLHLNEYVIVVPTTYNGSAGSNNAILGYTCILHDSRVATLTVETQAPGGSKVGNTIPVPFSWTQFTNSTSAVGLTFRLTGKNVNSLTSNTISSLVTIFGNENGASDTMEITVDVANIG